MDRVSCGVDVLRMALSSALFRLTCYAILLCVCVAASGFEGLEFVRHVYGSGLAMRLATEQKIAREQDMLARAPGLESSNLYGEIVSGQDTKLQFSDFLSLPEFRPTLPMENPHMVMERRLNM